MARGTVKPTYPVIQYPHNREAGGDAIANGFVYRGKLIPALRDKLVFGDITTGRIWYANRADVLAADDGNPTTVAPIYEIDTDLRRITEETYRERGGKGQALPGMGDGCRPGPRGPAVCGGQRRRALHPDQERRHDQESRRPPEPQRRPRPPRLRPLRAPGQNVTSQPAASLKNPVASTPESIAAGKRAYDANCAACHGNLAQGAVKAGMTISIIEEQRGKQPPDLTDDQWDHGSTDGDIFAVIKRGVPPTMMPGFDGRIPDDEIWSIVNYLRRLSPKR